MTPPTSSTAIRDTVTQSAFLVLVCNTRPPSMFAESQNCTPLSREHRYVFPHGLLYVEYAGGLLIWLAQSMYASLLPYLAAGSVPITFLDGSAFCLRFHSRIVIFAACASSTAASRRGGKVGSRINRSSIATGAPKPCRRTSAWSRALQEAFGFSTSRLIARRTLGALAIIPPLLKGDFSG